MTQMGFNQLHKFGMPLRMIIEANGKFSKVHQHQLTSQSYKLLYVKKHFGQWSHEKIFMDCPVFQRLEMWTRVRSKSNQTNHVTLNNQHIWCLPNLQVQVSDAHHQLRPNIKVLRISKFPQQHCASAEFVRKTTRTMWACTFEIGILIGKYIYYKIQMNLG